MNNPLVSIIIPTFNRAHLIGETLDSIIAQTYANWECIIVDDGSTDETEQLINDYIKKDARFQYHKRPKDRLAGGNAARNFGFELSKGEYVNWFDDDDLMLEDFLQTVINARSNYNLIILRGKTVDSNKRQLKKIKNWLDTDCLFKQYVLNEIEILTPSLIFKKTFLINKELFKTSLLRSQEVELYSRLFFKLKSEEYCTLNHIGFLYIKHNNSKSSQGKKYISEYAYAHFYVHSENLIRALKIKDQDLIDFCNKKIIEILFLMLTYKDEERIAKVLKKMKSIVRLKFYVKILVVTKVMLFLKHPHYKLKKYLINQKLT